MSAPRPPREPDPTSLNRPRPVPAISWDLDPDVVIALQIHRGPHSEVRACWWCPVCEAPVHRPVRAGRPRVYCTNACRQRAYRLRRVARQHRPFEVIVDPRPERATSRDRTHAIRDFADTSTGRRDSIGRGVTACGTFARMTIDTPWRFGHTEFRARQPWAGDTTCRRCEQLSGVLPRPFNPDDP